MGVDELKDFANRSSWSRADKIAALVFGLLFLWFAVPSSLFLKPVSLTVSKTGQIEFVRETPFGPVTADWIEEWRHENRECGPASGRSLYQEIGLNPINFGSPEPLKFCLHEDGNLVVEQRRWVLVLGVIPLRPIQTKWFCPTLGKPCEIVQ